MLFTLGVLFVCTAAVIFGLLPAICRYRESSWLASETTVLCFSAPLVMLSGALGVGMLAWVAIHGGLWAAMNGQSAIASSLIVVTSVVVWRLLLSVVRGGRTPAIVRSAALVAGTPDVTGTRPPGNTAPAA